MCDRSRLPKEDQEATEGIREFREIHVAHCLVIAPSTSPGPLGNTANGEGNWPHGRRGPQISRDHTKRLTTTEHRTILRNDAERIARSANGKALPECTALSAANTARPAIGHQRLFERACPGPVDQSASGEALSAVVLGAELLGPMVAPAEMLCRSTSETARFAANLMRPGTQPSRLGSVRLSAASSITGCLKCFPKRRYSDFLFCGCWRGSGLVRHGRICRRSLSTRTLKLIAEVSRHFMSCYPAR